MTESARAGNSRPGGYLMFDNRKGRVEIRHVTLQTRDLNELIPTDELSLLRLAVATSRTPAQKPRVGST